MPGRSEVRSQKSEVGDQEDELGAGRQRTSKELGGGKVTWLQDHRTIDYDPCQNQKGVALLQSKLLANRARARVSLISACRGTGAVLPLTGFV